MNTASAGTFIISQEIGNQFAEASGDYNPLHVNPIMARRYQFGSTVVHGVGGLLKAIDIVTGQLNTTITIDHIKVQFNNPIRHGDLVEVSYSNPKENELYIELLTSGKRAQIIRITYSNIEKNIPIVNENQTNTDCSPKDLDFKDSLTIDTSIDLTWNKHLITELFPNLARFVPDSQIAILLGLTKIVGMNCPGLNSVFAGFNISFTPQLASFESKLRYSIAKADQRFSLITIAIEHSHAKGEIDALFRPKPIQQPAYSQIKALVKANQFENQRALIIGGSRGIGEVTAKLISAGGGCSTITYAKGTGDAKKIVDDIHGSGGKANSIHYDIFSPNPDIVRCFQGEAVTHIYYFASPLIEKSDGTIWNQALFLKFSEYYLHGLANLLDLFLKAPEYRKRGITIFIPSTIFIEQPQFGFTEYVAAKSAIETFALQFQKKYTSWHIATPRLPRMLTDQTSGVADDDPLQAATIMLDAITNMPQKNDK